MEHLTFKIPKIILVYAKEKKLCEISKGIIANDMVLGNDELDRKRVIIDYFNCQLHVGKKVIEFKRNILGTNMKIFFLM